MVKVFFPDGSSRLVTAIEADTLIKSGMASIKPYNVIDAVSARNSKDVENVADVEDVSHDSIDEDFKSKSLWE